MNDRERVARRFFERLDAMLVREEEPSSEVAVPERQVAAEDGPTVRSPEALSAGVVGERMEKSEALEGERRDASPQAPHAQDAPAPPVARAPAGLVGTAPMLELPAGVREQMRELPFKPALPGQPKAVKTLQVPVMRSALGETAPLGDDSLAKAVAALPFAGATGATVGAGKVLIPRLKLEEYASLCAELLIWPERVGAILPRYHVPSEAARWALDEHWREHFAALPAARAAFEKAVAGFTAWLRTGRG